MPTLIDPALLLLMQGGGTVTPPPPVPVDLLRAIHAEFRSAAPLLVAFPVGAGDNPDQSTIGLSSPDTPFPHADIYLIGKSPRTGTTGVGGYTTQAVQINVYADNYEDASDLADLVATHFHRNFLTFQRGYVMAAEAGETIPLPPTSGPTATGEVWGAAVTITYLIGRNMPR